MFYLRICYADEKVGTYWRLRKEMCRKRPANRTFFYVLPTPCLLVDKSGTRWAKISVSWIGRRRGEADVAGNARKWWRTNKSKLNQQQQAPSQTLLDKNLAHTEELLRLLYTNCSDIVFRSFLIFGSTPALLIYIDGLANIEELDARVLAPLMVGRGNKEMSTNDFLQKAIPVSKWQEISTLEACVESISCEYPVLLIDQQESAISIGLPKWEKRSVEEPVAEGVVRGPREGFT